MDHSRISLDVRAALAQEGSRSWTTPRSRSTQALRERFLEEIFPVLTPLAVDPGHPFPYISTLSLSIAVGLRDPESGERRFARVKVPQILPRLIVVEPSRFVLIDQVIEANLDALFLGMEIIDHHLFRVTRNADLAIEEDEADDLLMAIEEEAAASAKPSGSRSNGRCRRRHGACSTASGCARTTPSRSAGCST